MPARPLTVPPFAVLLGLLNLGPAAQSAPADDHPVALPFAVLRVLLRGALASQPFDEERYLSLNPDVAAAVLRGDIGSGQEHYATDGYFEGRVGGADAFTEAWYISRNDDVAAAIQAGAFASGRDHYDQVGRFELRSPTAATEADMALWRACRTPPAVQAASTPSSHAPIELDSMRRRSAR